MKITHIFNGIEETRSTINQKYPVAEINFLVVASFICGYSNWHAIARFCEANIDWLRNFFPYTNGLPTRHNIARIIRLIKPKLLNELLINWTRSYQSESMKNQL
ncbi:transposase family protein [Thorsellia kenyensis]|uniref:Transposase family protein n=1 Tax=Thorsellia kenyensis TaxID=1549888 RepID=A0ABV6CA79_9GAMM